MNSHLSDMFEGHMSRLRAERNAYNKRKLEMQWKKLGSLSSAKKREVQQRYQEQSRTDWRVKDKIKVIATKINRKKREARDYKFVNESDVETQVLIKMANNDCTALEAIALLSQEV